ncbi:hypothetical protein KC660_02685, partial [Candidatus Dojkabacteria bacterium]|nr:hypothetical protein [Candidatus Dojkabacteria bacterium]
HHLNECTIDLTECSSSSAKVVCNGANPNSLYCSPHDDSIKNAPLKQPTDANVVGACKDNDSKATLSYKFKNDDAANYRLGFEITSPKGSQIVSALIQQYPDAKLNSSGEYTDNTSKMITQNLSTAPLKSTMSNGHVDVSLNGLESRLNYPGFLSQFNRDLTKDENIKFQTDVDAGIDKLEYLFELMCYLDSSLSPDQAPCNKILRDNNTPLTMAAYDDLSDYPFFANLRDQILSCNLNSNKQSYTGKNADMFVGGSGSYVSYFEITPEMIDPTNSTAIRKPTPTLTVETTPSLFIQRINWIVSSMLSDEKDFLTVNANEPALQKKLEEAYQACMLQAGEKYGSAAEVNYRLVLEKQEPLACPAGSIRMADYQWRRVATGKVGTAYIPGLALVYEFMSQLPTQTGSLVPGMTFRFNPSAENPCALILEK